MARARAADRSAGDQTITNRQNKNARCMGVSVMWLCKRFPRDLTRMITWGCIFAAASVAVASPHVPQVGDDPPDVFGRSSTGEAIHLKDYHGKIVVISFWASWCGPCRRETPMLMKLQKHATREKVIVLSVNWKQSRDEFQAIKKIFKDQDTEVTLISDESGRAGEAYGVKGIPHMVIIGKD